MSIDARHLRSFAAVARAGSFSRAADELGYTQSAVSQHVAALELQLDQRLLERRPVRLTEAGTRLLRHANAVLLRLDAAEAELRPPSADAPVRIGMTTLAGAALGALLGELRPSGVEVRSLSVEGALRAVARGELAVALVDGFVGRGEPLLLADPGIFVATLERECDAVVVLAAGHPLEAHRAASLAQLADARWIDAPRVSAPLAELRALAGSAAGFGASAAYDGHDLETLLALVALGLGGAVVPETASVGRQELVALALSEPPIVHRVERVRLRRPVDRPARAAYS